MSFRSSFQSSLRSCESSQLYFPPWQRKVNPQRQPALLRSTPHLDPRYRCSGRCFPSPRPHPQSSHHYCSHRSAPSRPQKPLQRCCTKQPEERGCREQRITIHERSRLREGSTRARSPQLAANRFHNARTDHRPISKPHAFQCAPYPRLAPLMGRLSSERKATIPTRALHYPLARHNPSPPPPRPPAHGIQVPRPRMHASLCRTTRVGIAKARSASTSRCTVEAVMLMLERHSR